MAFRWNPVHQLHRRASDLSGISNVHRRKRYHGSVSQMTAQHGRASHKAHRAEKQTERQRFWRKVDIRGPDECWPWIAGRDFRGYGRFRTDERPTWSHIYALEEKLGRKLHPGCCSMHSCDNPPCNNPAHLFEGTVRENTEEMWDKGRAKPGGIPRKRNGMGHR